MMKLTQKYSRISSTLLTLTLTIGLTACAGEENVELKAYVSEVKARQKTRIPPLPKPKSFEVFTYDEVSLRNPFEPTVEIQAAESNNGLKPDMTREREALEEYAVGSLKMMGILEKNNRRWALIRTSDGTLYRITTGRYLGKNNGKVMSITETQLELKEIVPDGLGGWIERMTTLSVSE